MGVKETEEIVVTIKAILKTLECPICLELLKTPVSAGCGHFFCRHCVSGILQSTYRAPCPLCKRSFTRRSVQEASQRETVILAAKLLANTCSSLTGVKFLGTDICIKETGNSVDDISVPVKKFRHSHQGHQDVPSRKRKSFENEVNTKSAGSGTIPHLKTKEFSDQNKNLPTEAYSSPNKRTCPDSDEDSEDLPKLEDFLCQFQKSSNVPDVEEKSLSIQTTNKGSDLKTYSSAHRKAHKMNLQALNSDAATNVDSNKSTSKISSLDKNNIDEKLVENELKTHLGKRACVVLAKNKINALKNKTNEDLSDQVQNENSNIKNKNLKESKATKIETGNKSKENALYESPVIKKLSKFKRKSQTKTQNNSNINITDEVDLKENVSNREISSKDPTALAKDCYTLNQITLLHSQNTNENEECVEKGADDPLNAIGLNDTAVSVGSVASPLATKNLSVYKSPGWSRVKKVKKDFKMKKFTSLHVEKNSPHTSSKNTTVSDQEVISDKLNLSLDIHIKDRNENNFDSKLEDAPQIESEESVSFPDKGEFKKNTNATMMNNNNENSLVVENKESSTSENISNVQNKICEDMDYSVNNKHESNTNEDDVHVSMKRFSELKTVPSMSIASHSLICTKYSNIKGKNCGKNAQNSEKVICELQKNTSFNDLTNKMRNISDCVVQEDCLNVEKNNVLFNSTEMKQGAFSFPVHISEYQNFHTQSVKNDDEFQYVEQSQQTSQMFNLGFQNPMCDNLRAVVPHQLSHQPPVFYPNIEKTKVVKRTCLTLEEIQDCFLKSNQTGCSETLCSVSFLSGLFKLHIGVSDETLNVSVLKVIESNSESNAATNAISVLSDKHIQTTSSLFPPIEVVPSSNAGSESSQPESVDPYPYLNKEASKVNALHFPVLPVEANFSVTDAALKESTVAVSDEKEEPATIKDSAAQEISEYNHENNDHHMDEDDLEISEIIHFPPNPADRGTTFQKDSDSSEHLQAGDFKQPLQKTNTSALECDLPLSKEDCNSNILTKTKVFSNDMDDLSNSDGEDESLKKLQQCVSKERTVNEKKASRLSLKKTSFRRIEIPDSSDDSDLETSVSDKKISKNLQNEDILKSDNLPKVASCTEKLSFMRGSTNMETSNTTVQNSVPVDMPSTLNSILSEDASETNASEIIFEIEDLSDKIKSLEEKLKLCGHSDSKLNKSSGNGCQNESDSEDSTDLFPQSVPPTPPNHI